MDVNYPESSHAFRSEVKKFLRDSLPDSWQGAGKLAGKEYLDFIDQWRKTLFREGYLGLAWPKEYGGAGLTLLEQVIVFEEFAKVGAPTGCENDVFSVGMAGNAILEFGTEEQKNFFLPGILSGELVFCQGFSEPGAGSDLASLKTKASLEGDRWIFSGQKTWTSYADTANWMMLLARTDSNAAKHKGISFFFVPTQQAGVEFRPIKMMSGASDFCETFIDNAETARDNILGEVNKGWAVATRLLQYERGEAAATLAIKFRADLDRLVKLAREQNMMTDPEISKALIWCHTRVEIMKYLGWRYMSSYLRGEKPGPESSIMKCYWTEYLKQYSDLAMKIYGSKSLFKEGRMPMSSYQTDDIGAPNSTASWQSVFLDARAASIYAGTNEVQRNIIAERILGLPR